MLSDPTRMMLTPGSHRIPSISQVLLMPSAFAVKTGQAHWETLLRCRAIENQCYVVAAAQTGQHNTDGNQRRSYGHAVAFDPWGTQVAYMGAEATGVTTFEVQRAPRVARGFVGDAWVTCGVARDTWVPCGVARDAWIMCGCVRDPAGLLGILRVC